jgi:hypothetical protein
MGWNLSGIAWRRPANEGLMDTKKRRPPRRKRSAPLRKKLPPASPPPPKPPTQQPLTETWAALDQTAQQVREMHEEHLQRGFAATLSGGSISEPLPIAAAERGAEANFTVVVSEPPVSVVSTVYPTEPGGAVLVQNHITINVNTTEFRQLNSKLDELIGLLRSSNEISGDTRNQLIAEITAGKILLTAPKSNAALIDLLLKRPLTFIAKQVAGTVIGRIAGAALALLGKLTGLW